METVKAYRPEIGRRSETEPHVLLAVAEPETRGKLESLLRSWGFDPLVAENGTDAWEILQSREVWLLIASLGLPELDGVELCREIRHHNHRPYIYTIIITPKADDEALARAMEAGADEFLVAPFVPEELRVRIVSAKRLIRAEEDLESRNQELLSINQKLSRAQEVITRDLEAAARIQQGLLPCCAKNLYGYSFETLFIPCQVVGGDMFNFFPIDANHIAYYVLDVSGHGIPAAMLSVAVSKTISSLPFHENIVRGYADDIPRHEMTSPASVVRELDQLFQTNDLVEQYFTMIYGVLNRDTGQTCFTQAGHPYPVYLPYGGEPRQIGTGGLPVGLLHDAEFNESCQDLGPLDRLFLYSDGIIECTGANNEQFGMEGLLELLKKTRDLPLNMLMRKIGEELYRFHGDESFDDDISLMVIQREEGP